MYRISLHCIVVLSVLSLQRPQPAAAQGTLDDYKRAQQFLPGNLRHSIYVADVPAHWIAKTNTFWYRKVGREGSEFVRVDASHNTVAPAFDHAKVAAAVSRSSKREYSAIDLPFDAIEFTDDQKAIRFEIEKTRWICPLDSYDCKQESGENPGDTLSPDKKWAAYVKEHNLYVRNVSTGTNVQLTHDGVSGWDYATPLPALR